MDGFHDPHFLYVCNTIERPNLIIYSVVVCSSEHMSHWCRLYCTDCSWIWILVSRWAIYLISLSWWKSYRYGLQWAIEPLLWSLVTWWAMVLDSAVMELGSIVSRWAMDLGSSGPMINGSGLYQIDESWINHYWVDKPWSCPLIGRWPIDPGSSVHMLLSVVCIQTLIIKYTIDTNIMKYH